MLEVIMANGGFTVAWLRLKELQRDRRRQHKHMFSCFSSLLLLNRVNLNQATPNSYYHANAYYYG